MEAKTKGFFVADSLIRVLCLLFFLLGILKFHGLMFPSEAMREYLSLANPLLFFFSNRWVLYATALIEIVIGVCGLGGKDVSLTYRTGLLLWFTIVATAYKLSLILMHYQGPCGCLLGINKFLPMSTTAQRSLTNTLLVVTALASIFVLLYLRKLKPDVSGLGQQLKKKCLI